MSLPSGTYNIINKNTGKYANLSQSTVAPFAPIIGWTSAGTGGSNEKWVLVSQGSNVYTIRSNLDTNAYASADINAPGGLVTNGTRVQMYEIPQVQGGYRVKISGVDLTWVHLNTNDADGLRIRLQPTGTTNEVWTFVQVA